jgi:hypothetical protein
MKCVERDPDINVLSGGACMAAYLQEPETRVDIQNSVTPLVVA